MHKGKTTFYFIRHGETDYNRQGIVQGRGVDASLNATGRAQAHAVAQRLANTTPDVIYTSTLLRAVETAEIIALPHHAVPVHRMADLEEMAWGIYEGMPLSWQIQRDFEGFTARWKRGELDFRIEGGETILEVQKRGKRAMLQLLERHDSGTVFVITHGRFLRVLLATLLDEYGLERMHEIAHANTAVNTIHWDEGRFEATLLNCTAHLETAVFEDLG